MIRFIHTADIHFGMENYGKIDPTTGIHTRLLDFQKALNTCIDYALQQSVDFFLFSGDAYKTMHPSPTQQKLLVQCFMRLHQAGIPVVIIVGNHDNPLSFGKAHALDIFGALPVEGFHVIAKPTVLQLHTKHGPVNIVGIPWPSRTNIALPAVHAHKTATALTDYISASVSSLIAQFAQELDPHIPAVLAGHLTVASGIFSGSEKRAIYGCDPVFLPSQLALFPFDYVALGHLHRHQNLNPHGYPAVVYAGSIERIDFGERNEPKGFCDVIIEKKGHTTYTFVEVPTRPFIQIEVTLPPQGNQTNHLIACIQQHSLEQAIIKIIYIVPANAQDTVDLQAVLHACNTAHHIVSITPVHIKTKREKRTLTHHERDLPTLLTTYFNQKPEWAAAAASLVEKTLALQEEVQDQQETEDGSS